MLEKKRQKLSLLKSITWKSFRFKIIFFSSLMLLFTVLISISLMHTMGKTILRDQIFFDLSAIAKSKSDQVVSIIEQDFERVALVASRTQLRKYLLDLDRAADSQTSEESREGIIKILQDARNSVPAVKDIDIINLGGTVIASTDLAKNDQDKIDQDFFQQALQGPYQSGFNKEKNQFTYSLALPLIHPEAENENIIGVVKVVLSLERMMTVLTDRTGLKNTGEVVLVSKIENQFVAMNPLRHYPDGGLTVINTGLTQAMRNAIRGDSGFLQENDYRGVAVLAAFCHVPVEGKDWGLIVKIDDAEAFAPLRTMQRIFILIAVIIWILGSLVLSGIVTILTAPVKKLVNGTKKLGEGNLEHRIHITSQDELGELTSAFNKMAENLQKITASRNELDREITERLKIEGKLIEAKEEAEAANKAKSVFLANMSHELRTPLNGIIGFSDILRNTPLGDEQIKYVNTVYTSGKLLTDIIADILDFSRIEAGKFELHPKKTNLKELIEKTLFIVRYRAVSKGLSLSVNIGHDVPQTVELDGPRLRQILLNLLSNAVKFTDEGSVHLSVNLQEMQTDKARLLFKVSDTGMGIKQEEQTRIFEPFQQADMSTSKKAEGTGLGLTISKEMLEMMGGTLALESEYSKGSTFSFELLLPCEQERLSDSEEQDSENSDEQTAFTNKKVLIAEDNPINMQYVQTAIDMLSKDIQVIKAKDGKEAYRLFLKQNPDLILMDIRMPHLDGYQATAMIRSHNEDIPIIAMTAKALEEDKENALAAGMNEYITKPVSLERLNEVLKKHLLFKHP